MCACLKSYRSLNFFFFYNSFLIKIYEVWTINLRLCLRYSLTAAFLDCLYKWINLFVTFDESAQSLMLRTDACCCHPPRRRCRAAHAAAGDGGGTKEYRNHHTVHSKSQEALKKRQVFAAWQKKGRIAPIKI